MRGERGRARAVQWLGAIAVTACGGSDAPARAPGESKAVPTPIVDAATAWASSTEAPRAPGSEGREAALTRACGEGDGGLARVASALARSRATGGRTDFERDVVGAMRVEGVPYVAPRVVTLLANGALDDQAIAERLSTARTAHGVCGLAVQPSAGGEIVVAVVAAGLASLSPIPTRARTGEWLAVDATLHVSATGARVVLLGPRGAPRTIPTAFDEGRRRVRARFALDRPGAFTLQVVADLDDGPRPILEARIFADTPPTTAGDTETAPGEDAGGGAQDADALGRMIVAARAADAAGPVTRDRELDRLAQSHAAEMRDRHTVAHDVGRGDPRARAIAAGLPASRIDENVARAATVELAHRAIYASPSHRLNLLRPDNGRVGVGVASSRDGTFVCEIFTP